MAGTDRAPPFLSPGRCAVCGQPSPAFVCEPCRSTLWAPKPRVTHCRHGHAYTPENIVHNGRGRRLCRICKNARERARHARLRQQANGV